MNHLEMTVSPEQAREKAGRLSREASPYLRQHATNPVDWYPWGEEAFARAKADDKPVFLSVGYSACHWCHVMERESFQRRDVADLLNAHFIAIKVDREERPDLDAIYMAATQLLTGRGGWPNSVFLTPDRRPWFAGAYWPAEDADGRPGFKTILRRLAETWRTRRKEVEAVADRLAEGVREYSAPAQPQTAAGLSPQVVARAVEALRADFDTRFGGFGDAPKFPPHAALRLLLREHQRSKDDGLLEMLTRTLDAVARGGIRDHLGGGFHRYATDRQWLLPHFEKMLYDNAQLARAYVDAWRITGGAHYRRAAQEALEWVLREMTDPAGGFYSALDADSEGEEGKFYLWRYDEILEVLGPRDGLLFCRVYGVEKQGNHRDEATGRRPGTNVLHLARPLEVTARVEGIDPGSLRRRLAAARRRLLRRRGQRVRPALDDKVLTGWNGLMIGALAHAGRHLRRRRYVAAAERAAEFVLTTMRNQDRLLRSYREGSARLAAYLEDYAYLADGLLDLHEAAGDRRWLTQAQALFDAIERNFRDLNAGGYFATSAAHGDLLARTKDAFDGQTPSANGVAARVAVRLARLTGREEYLRSARATLDALAGFLERAPQAAATLALAAGEYFDAAPSQAASSAARSPSRTPSAPR